MVREFNHSIIDPNGGGYETKEKKADFSIEDLRLTAENMPGVSTFEVKHRNEPVTMHPLHKVFVAAIDQCTHGKGERHGGCATPFLEQPWAHYAKLHGRGFLTGQAAKKLEEAASTREGEAFINEMLGAIVYIGMAILNEQEKMKND